ncbi:GDP-mannose 4,6-dehydratase [Ferruginibacter sp. SUN002]|uniref:GDP-mannose 4,6-dehydratase n=1 Tax=Ferruginibacter sp. SUN002 TaxID=2937789 RepID=UPI003D3687FB
MQLDNKILVTGAIGFIGFHLSNFFLKNGFTVFGIDSMNEYYDINLKTSRLNILSKHENFTFKQVDICDKQTLDKLFAEEKFDIVINLAAQAGVRYSIDHPYKYIDSNLIGFINILEACRNFPVKHMIFASSSSVYGSNTKIPFSVSDQTDSPVSLYAATKKANELMAYSYSHLYNIPMTGLRFFTVYGPWGRPDMAYYSFTKNIIEGKPIKLYNNGKMRRDFTYVDDVVSGIYGLLEHLSKSNFAWTNTEKQIAIFNIGNNKPVELIHFVQTLENVIGKKANIEMLPMQDGDVVETYADIDCLKKIIGFNPKTNIEEGLQQFFDWYKVFNQTN